MTFSACQRYKGLGNSVGDSFWLHHGLKWTLQEREHRNLWKRGLWGCWSWDKNRNKAECWLTNVPNYRDFLTDKCSCQLFSCHNGHCWFPVRRQKKIMHGKPVKYCQKGEAVNAPRGFLYLGKTPYSWAWRPPPQPPVPWLSPNLQTNSLVILDTKRLWFLIEAVQWVPFQASSYSKIFQLVEINPIEVPLSTNQMRLDCNWGKL